MYFSIPPVSENLWSTFWYPLTTDAGNDSDQDNNNNKKNN